MRVVGTVAKAAMAAARSSLLRAEVLRWLSVDV